MQKLINFLKIKPITSLAIILMMSTLSACDKSPSEHLQALTAGKYPVANMPEEPLETPLEINIEPKRLAMTSSWSAGVKDDGTLWTWGTDGLLRDTKTGQDPTPRQVEGVNDAVAVSGGGGHMLLLRQDGTVWGWGSNSHGEIDPSDDDTFIEELREIKGIENVIGISAGTQVSFFINNEKDVFVLGNNEYGVLSTDKDKILNKPTRIKGLRNIVKILGGADSFLALNVEGDLYSSAISSHSLGKENVKALVTETGKKYYPVTRIELKKRIVDFDYSYANLAPLENGEVWSWRDTNYTGSGKSKDSFIFTPTRILGLSKVNKVNAFSVNTNDGDLYLWGLSTTKCEKCSNGGNSSYFYQPVLISNDIKINQFADSFSSTAYIDDNGYAWFVGNNRHGEKGTGEVQTDEYITKEKLLVPEKSLFNIHANK